MVDKRDCNVVDIARTRRIRFESQRSEMELARLTFDAYGNPVPLFIDSPSGEKNVTIRERMGDDVADALVQMRPDIARKLGLFPALRVVKK